MKMSFLSTHDVRKTYGGFVALNNVSLSIEQGEIRALIGPNGAGKSTLIDVMSGRGKSGGRIEFKGSDISTLTPSQRRHIGISRSFQKTSIFPNLTVRQQMELASRATGSKDSDAVMEEFGLATHADTFARDLSYGDQRRLDLATAMTGAPSLLLLDEPAAGLSVEESKHMSVHLRDLATRRGITVILVEHDMDVVFSVADRISVLHLGQVLAEGEPANIRKNEAVVRAYLGSAA